MTLLNAASSASNSSTSSIPRSSTTDYSAKRTCEYAYVLLQSRCNKLWCCCYIQTQVSKDCVAVCTVLVVLEVQQLNHTRWWCAMIQYTHKIGSARGYLCLYRCNDRGFYQWMLGCIRYGSKAGYCCGIAPCVLRHIP